MTNRREVLTLGILGGATLLAPGPAAAQSPPADPSVAAMSALADRYAAAVNAHDTSSFADIHTGSYIQHSGRSPSGLAAQIELFKRIFAAMPDLRMVVEDRIIAGDKIVTRNSFSATHTTPIRGIPPYRQAVHVPHHRHLARRERQAGRALGRHRHGGSAAGAAR